MESSIPNGIQKLASDAFRGPRFAAGEAGAKAGHVEDMADGRGCKDGASECVRSQLLNPVRYKRPCPVCETTAEGPVFVEQNICTEQLSQFSFSSRKNPEFFSHRLIVCPTCGVIYAPTPPTQTELRKAYQQADFDSQDEAQCAALSYDSALAPFLTKLLSKGTALEIGTGTGAFLPYLQRAGFSTVRGVEPSLTAIERADPNVKPLIQAGMFEPLDYQTDSLSLVCCFQTLEHILHPKAFVEAAFSLLEPGGMIALVTHDYSAWLNRLLGKRSPIVDIEHLQLFHPNSLQTLLSTAGFKEISIHPIKNKYRIWYWTRLLPIPPLMKRLCLSTLELTGLGQIKLGMNVGNQLAIGRRP